MADDNKTIPPLPLPGHLLILQNGVDYPCLSDGSIGVLDGMIDIPKDEYLVTFNPTTPYRDGKLVSTGGGPAFYVAANQMKYSGTVKRYFWRWKDGYPGRDRDEQYLLETHVWTLDWSTFSNHT